MGVSYQWFDGHWYKYRCYKRKNYYYIMWIVIWEGQSIWALADILLTWNSCVIVFSLLTRIVVIIEVVMYYVDTWLIEVNHYLLIWNNIVHMHWHEIEYKLGTWRSSVRKLFDFIIVHWDRSHRHVEIVRVGI